MCIDEHRADEAIGERRGSIKEAICLDPECPSKGNLGTYAQGALESQGANAQPLRVCATEPKAVTPVQRDRPSSERFEECSISSPTSLNSAPHSSAHRHAANCAARSSGTTVLSQHGPALELLKLFIAKMGGSDRCRLLHLDVALDRLLTLAGADWGVLFALKGATVAPIRVSSSAKCMIMARQSPDESGHRLAPPS